MVLEVEHESGERPSHPSETLFTYSSTITAAFMTERFNLPANVVATSTELETQVATLNKSLQHINTLAQQYETVDQATSNPEAQRAAIDDTVNNIIDIISRLPIVNNTTVRAKVNGALPDAAYETADGYKLQGILFLLSLRQPESHAQTNTIVRHATRFIEAMTQSDPRRQEIEEKVTIFTKKLSSEQPQISTELLLAKAVEKNSKEFERLREVSATAHLQAIAIPRIDRTLRKAYEYHLKYEKENQKLAELEAQSPFIEFTQYDPEIDQHVVKRIERPNAQSHAQEVEQKRRSVAALKGWDNRHASDIEKNDWITKKSEYEQGIDQAAQMIDTAMEKIAQRKEDFVEGAVLAVRTLAKNTADPIAAPFMIERMINFLKQRGLYEEIDTVLPNLQAFAERSLTAFLPEGKQLSQKDIRKHVNDMFRYSSLTYVRDVLLAEGRTDMLDVWKKKADTVEPHHITKKTTSAIFDIYRQVGIMKYTNVHGAFERLKKSPLVAKGGILEYTPYFSKGTIYQTKRPFKGDKDVRPSMLVASLDGVSNNALRHLPLGGGGMYDDPRVSIAIQSAQRRNAESGFSAYINRPGKKRTITPIKEAIQEVLHDTRTIRFETRVQTIYSTPEYFSPTEEQWKSVTAVMNQLIKEENSEVMDLFANATESKKPNTANVVRLFELALGRLSAEARKLFPSGHYDMATQLAGYFMVNPEAYILPAKKRNPEGKIEKTYVVVYKNPLQADSSYTDRH